VDLVAACPGRVVVMGLGKSGLIGRKIAATMSSVGIPAVFLHPAECLHGDIGMIMPGDAVILLSYSGETDEIKKVMPAIKRMGIKVIVMTGRSAAPAWKDADLIINSKIDKEACPYNLAPTASTTAMLALGDALALSASEKKGFKKEHLARFHPSGGIGKKLTMKVRDIMRTGKNNPVLADTMTVNDALLVMTRTRLGATSITNAKGRFAGFFTDGDLRRQLQKDPSLLSKRIKEVMTMSPLTISPDVLAVEAARILKKHNFDNIPVVNEKGKPVGIVDERDLLAEGIVE
jgi:arabinose-5-phosphate isomerase